MVSEEEVIGTVAGYFAWDPGGAWVMSVALEDKEVNYDTFNLCNTMHTTVILYCYIMII